MTIDEREDMLQRGWPQMAFIEHKLAGDPTNWWAPNHACIEAMLRTCGLRVKEHPGHEMYIAVPDEALQPVTKSWNQSEYLSAIGQDWMQAVDSKVKHTETR